jgi:hypothetical protein
LNSDEWRAVLAEGLADAMDIYFEGRTAMMSAQPGG